ncbi:putative GNAT family N-acyltransferase [Pedobacter cryoconitis]|uniref:Putative GNAT family N-acyltransferase n=1 Tax=Pedobacter cryoconitis TaxID=188932 RepID=A0A7W8ZSF7_9SPHI|nr:GNAT family N-acetyltransferase [Pedobacter cryoconitis]MBB5639357.1 putative GNAT family N-acyltransferase [Pedobacter cryoconitis]
MIRRISKEDTLPLRSQVLRANRPLEDCVFATDDIEGGFHLGCFENGELISICTFIPENYKEKGEGGYRLRAMATNPAFAGQGFGAKLINFALNELRLVHASYIWCNARTVAVGFYNRLGFEVISEEFEVPGIGPHYDMFSQIADK